MLRVAIIGCGKIADAHASQIMRIKGCRIVAVCDREPLMAKQLHERYPIDAYYTDIAEMFRLAKPNVVHITTPPQGHYDIARECLERGANVYVEKPFTINEPDARALVALAEEKGLKLTVGHDDQFSHAAMRMREIVQSGYLGGTPVHMESYFCYDLGDPSYARALLGNKEHWVRKLPGKLLQNIISHGVARIAEFMECDTPTVIAHGSVSHVLRGIGETELMDELRVIITDNDRTTAYFTFSSQMCPSLHQFRIFGPKNGLLVDQDKETVLKLRGAAYKSYAEKFVPQLTFAKQYISNFNFNVRRFLGNDFHMKTGLKYLAESFYHSIEEGTPVPIPYREIVLTAYIMDKVFEQLEAQRLQQETRDRAVTAGAY
jgi:predicted dehydrogenase